MKIEHDIPIPKRRGKQLSREAELMLTLKPGDSLWLDKPHALAVQFAIRYVGKGRYACRSEDSGTRVWRII